MRVLPPVHSPLTARALVRAAGARADDVHLRAAEKRIRDAYRPLEAVLTDTGTSALRLALEAVSSVDNAPVALPAYNCYDLVSAARGAAIRTIYYDIDPTTLGPDEASLRRALEAGARSVVIAYLFGVPIDLDAVRAVTDPYGAFLIEDAAQGVGGSYRNRPLGAHGDLSVLSFARGKGRTGGGGGALMANSEAGRRVFSSAVPRLPASGRTGLVARALVQWVMGRPMLYGIPAALPLLHLGETRYREPRAPAGMPSASAAILEHSWVAADEEIGFRQSCAARFQEALADSAAVDLVEVPPGSTPGYLRFPVVYRGRVPPTHLEKGPRLGVVPAYPRILPQVCAEATDQVVDDLPGARRLSSRLWTLPCHRYVTAEDGARIVSLIDGDR